MNLVAKIRSLQAQVDELRAQVDEMRALLNRVSVEEMRERVNELDDAQNFDSVAWYLSEAAKTLPKAIAIDDPIASATIAPPPARRRGRPPKPKV